MPAAFFSAAIDGIRMAEALLLCLLLSGQRDQAESACEPSLISKFIAGS